MVGSEMSAKRVMRNLTKFIEEKLGLKYLGAKSIAKFKASMKKLTCRSWGVSNSYKVKKLNAESPDIS